MSRPGEINDPWRMNGGDRRDLERVEVNSHQARCGLIVGGCGICHIHEHVLAIARVPQHRSD